MKEVVMPASMKISVVVPCRDSRRTLDFALESLKNLRLQPDEIILVDDGSAESLEEVARCRDIRFIRLDPGRGPAFARNKGAESAAGDILLFIDADVAVNPEITALIQEDFISDQRLSAIQGIYSLEIPDKKIASRFQNYYYHYAFTSLRTEIVAICASFCFAIRREVFLEMEGFDANITSPSVEDENFGYALFSSGRRILLDPRIEVTHLAQYTVPALLKRKARMSFHQIKNLLRGRFLPVTGEESGGRSNPTHHSASTLASVILSGLIPFSILGGAIPASLTIAAYLACNIGFWRFVSRREPALSIPAFIGLTWLDHLAICCGIGSGFFHFISGNRY
jgi:glycosyltransferase involved in cell wall biosynthesis